MPTRLHEPTVARLPRDLIAAFRAVPTAVIADQLGGGHADPAIRPIRPFDSGTSLVGSAITALCEPGDYGAVHHALAIAEAGDVLVVAAGGRNDAAMIGDLLSGTARRRGICGVVVDGAVRDTGDVAAWPDYHMFTRWITPRGPSSMERGSVNGTVAFGGVTVAPYDLVIGDDDGLVFVPSARAEALLAPCLARVKAEADWRVQLASGKTTLEVFRVPPARKD
jgi:regulator of RNase E activity RraA